MIQTIFCSALLLLVVGSGLHAQSEPGPSPAGPAGARPSPPPVAATPPSPAPVTDAPALARDPLALDPQNLDPSVKPGEDFYRYANGNWMKNNPIPPDFSRWGSFNELIEKNNDLLKVIAEKAATLAAEQAGASKLEQAAASEVQKVGDFYASGMNEAAINRAKTQPLQDELKRLEGIKDLASLTTEIAHLHGIGVDALFFFTSGQDDKESTKVIAQLYQGGIGLPDRDYYLKEDDASKKLREQYVAHVTRMFSLLGDSAAVAAKNAGTVMEIETALARAARTRVELRDPQANYNKKSPDELKQLAPDFRWDDYFRTLGLSTPGAVNVGQPDFLKAANKLCKTVALDKWQTYLRWHLAHAAAPALSEDFVNENFAFFGKALTGTEKLKPRWKRVISTLDDEIGEALGKLYVAEHFPPEAKKRALEMVENLREALADRIKSNDWMDAPTKAEALKKLAAFTVKIGYPEKWRDYSLLQIDRGPFVRNILRSTQFEVARQLSKIGQPVDRSEWGITPPTVNAYYNPNLNEIVFPAGILQPPFFNPEADDAVNYGGMGAVIGHEMTHGFDDQGRQYDATGNLRDWWTPASAKAYDERARAIIEQYAAYEALPGLKINGELTQGENIADIGGLKIAYAAFQKALARNPGASAKKIDGLTPDQRFFLAWAQIWRANHRDEDLKLRIATDPHSPGRFRTIGPLSNMPEFQKAFALPEDSPMVRPAGERANIW